MRSRLCDLSCGAPAPDATSPTLPSQIILLTTSLDRSSVMKRFTVSSDDLLVRPVRAHALYEMVRPSSSVTSAVATTIARVNKLGKQFDNTMGETSPLKILLVDGECA